MPDGPAVSTQASASSLRSRVIAILPRELSRIDDTHVLHPFFHRRFDVGPIRLTSVAHTFNYGIAVLRDGVKPAARDRGVTGWGEAGSTGSRCYGMG